MPLEELIPREFPSDDGRQRMTYICSVHSPVAEPGLFERKKAKELVYKFPNGFHSSLTPGPDLGSYQIENRHVQALEMPGETKMKIRAVREKRRIGRVLLSEADQLPVFPINGGQMAGH